MKKFIKKVSAFMVVTSLVCSLAMPAFAEEAIAPEDAGNVIKVVEISAESPTMERDMLSKYKTVQVTFAHNGVFTPPSTYYYSQKEGGYTWKGTLNYVRTISLTTSFATAEYAGYVYTFEE